MQFCVYLKLYLKDLNFNWIYTKDEIYFGFSAIWTVTVFFFLLVARVGFVGVARAVANAVAIVSGCARSVIVAVVIAAVTVAKLIFAWGRKMLTWKKSFTASESIVHSNLSVLGKSTRALITL